MNALRFDDKTIQSIFGHEAAEDEDISRLKEYYFKSNTFERITSDLPLRILVGHKGVGKSALFCVAMFEDKEHNTLPILIRPDDVKKFMTFKGDFLDSINNWKTGLIQIVSSKILEKADIDGPGPLIGAFETSVC